MQHAQLASRGLVAVAGADAVRFLQGLVTNQMSRVERGGEGVYAGFLTAPGRILFDAFIHPVNKGPDFPRPEFLVDVDARAVDPLMAHLRKFKLRAKVSIDNASDFYSVHQVWGSNSASLWARSLPTHLPQGAVLAKHRFADIGGKDPRHPDMGVRFVLPNPSTVSPLPASAVQVPESQFLIHRLLNGIPEGMDDIFMNQSLPLESNFDLMDGVDFRKGCYLGQELTIRTFHTGVTRKRIVPVQFYREGQEPPTHLSLDTTWESPLPPSTTEIRAVESESPLTLSKREVGKFCRGVHNIGLALLRLEHVHHHPGASVGTTPEQQHVLEKPLALVGTDLRIRAFAPAWWPAPPAPSHASNAESV
ncbi:ccr4 associated factor [Chytriomyces hyalinus]|nr:ccr4 associated factor [Chytriomyces hyalinus]